MRIARADATPYALPFASEYVTARGRLERREMVLEAVGSELMAPIIDGEFYRNVKSIQFRTGPRVRIPKVVAAKAA